MLFDVRGSGADTTSLKATRVQGETKIQAQDENGYENCFSTTEFIYQANLFEGPFQAWGWQEARKVKFLSHEAKLWSRCRYGIPEIKHTFFLKLGALAVLTLGWAGSDHAKFDICKC